MYLHVRIAVAEPPKGNDLVRACIEKNWYFFRNNIVCTNQLISEMRKNNVMSEPMTYELSVSMHIFTVRLALDSYIVILKTSYMYFGCHR